MARIPRHRVRVKVADWRAPVHTLHFVEAGQGPMREVREWLQINAERPDGSCSGMCLVAP